MTVASLTVLYMDYDTTSQGQSLTFSFILIHNPNCLDYRLTHDLNGLLYSYPNNTKYFNQVNCNLLITLMRQQFFGQLITKTYRRGVV